MSTELTTQARRARWWSVISLPLWGVSYSWLLGALFEPSVSEALYARLTLDGWVLLLAEALALISAGIGFFLGVATRTDPEAGPRERRIAMQAVIISIVTAIAYSVPTVIGSRLTS